MQAPEDRTWSLYFVMIACIPGEWPLPWAPRYRGPAPALSGGAPLQGLQDVPTRAYAFLDPAQGPRDPGIPCPNGFEPSPSRVCVAFLMGLPLHQEVAQRQSFVVGVVDRVRMGRLGSPHSCVRPFTVTRDLQCKEK